MSDIVERLRKIERYSLYGELPEVKEAADEIERLRNILHKRVSDGAIQARAGAGREGTGSLPE